MNATKLPKEYDKSFEFEVNNKDTDKFLLLEPNENINYSVSVNKIEQYIIIEINQVDSLNIYYKIKLNLNEFYQLSKSFKMYDNLDEIYNSLINIFISKKVSILKKDKIISKILKVSLMDGKEQEINIGLYSAINKINYDTNTVNHIIKSSYSLLFLPSIF